MTTSLSSSPVGVLRDRYFVCSLLTSLVHYIACRRIIIFTSKEYSSWHKSSQTVVLCTGLCGHSVRGTITSSFPPHARPPPLTVPRATGYSTRSWTPSNYLFSPLASGKPFARRTPSVTQATAVRTIHSVSGEVSGENDSWTKSNPVHSLCGSFESVAV